MSKVAHKLWSTAGDLKNMDMAGANYATQREICGSTTQAFSKWGGQVCWGCELINELNGEKMSAVKLITNGKSPQSYSMQWIYIIKINFKS